jgi:hypothetical protein
MAKMVKFEDGKIGILMDSERQEVALTITNDGEVGVAAMFPESGLDPGEALPHAWLAEGIARAIADPDLFEELQELAERAHALSGDSEPEELGPNETPPQFEKPKYMN